LPALVSPQDREQTPRDEAIAACSQGADLEQFASWFSFMFFCLGSNVTGKVREGMVRVSPPRYNRTTPTARRPTRDDEGGLRRQSPTAWATSD
jgi:hypothetical protein